MVQLIIGLILFIGVHSIAIVSVATRDRWAEALGVNAWRGLYSLISAAGLVLLVMGYVAARQSPVLLYAPPLWTRHLAFLLMLPVFPLLLAAYLPGAIKARLKHPMLAAVKMWAVAHLIANGMLADLLLFGGLLAWAVATRISLKRRGQRPLMMPLPAPSPMNDVLAVVLGLGIYALVLFWLHGVLIGVPLLPR
ncbi:MAG TPA: NnrU family protein [Steroidobacteraceae bacterium]|nr:NnrU family protein [Steroidobacteraceae bacterium]